MCKVGTGFGFIQQCCAFTVFFILCLGADISNLDIDIDFVFNNRLLPLEILNATTDAIANEQLMLMYPSNGLLFNGDFDNALNSMEYHRRMINEFMLTNYVAQQILGTDDNFPINKRMGSVRTETTAAMSSGINTANETISATREPKSNHLLLNGEGMERYKTWLRNLAMLDAIRKKPVIAQQTKQRYHAKLSQHQNRRHTQSDKQDVGTGFSSTDEEEIDEGDITGYALTNTQPYEYSKRQLSFLKLPFSMHHTQWPIGPMAKDIGLEPDLYKIPNENANERGYETYDTAFNTIPLHTSDTPLHNSVVSATKEIGLKDITDIALTTLAFLSFGMFILQVLMCITMGKDDTSNMMMLPMETADEIQEGVEEIRRKRRSPVTISPEPDRLKMMNEVARRALFSIDVSFLKSEIRQSCVYRSLCESNRLARRQLNNQQYWIPIWSLGVSWLSSQLPRENLKLGDYSSILRSLKAIVVGLNGGDCSKLYFNDCQLY